MNTHSHPLVSRRTASSRLSMAALAVLQLSWLSVASATVVTNNLNSGAGSLRQEVINTPSGGTVTFDPALTAGGPVIITLTTGEIALNKTITIQGPGANLVTVSGNIVSRVFNASAGNVTIAGLRITEGVGSTFGGGVRCNGAASLTMRNCEITGNTTTAAGGGGIQVTGCSGTFLNCNISNNTSASQGGGIGWQASNSAHALTVINCTISGNNAIGGPGGVGTGIGGGMTMFCSTAGAGPTAVIKQCTFANNVGSGSNGSAFRIEAGGTGVTMDVSLFSNIFANHTPASPALDTHLSGGGVSATITSLGYNLSTNNGDGFLIGTGDLINANPMLDPLALNDGRTRTHKLLPGSAAIGASNATLRPADTFDLDEDANVLELLPVDQRGLTFARLSGGTMDIGAFEVQQPVAPVNSPTLGDVVTGNNAPNAAGAADGTQFDVLKRGGAIAENGNLVFPGTLTGAGVTLSPNNTMGLWKQVGSALTRLARSGDPAPEATGGVFDVLPTIPAINDSGEVTFLASLAIGSGAPAVTADTDTGLWSELGSTGLGILLRESDPIPGLTGIQVGSFASGAYATAKTSGSTGEAVFSVKMKGGSTDSGILRASITGATVTAVGVVARENTPMPGTAEQFGFLAGGYSDPVHMDATGNIVFGAVSKTTNRESVWYQPVAPAGTPPVKVYMVGTAATGDTAPGTSGATFLSIKNPTIGSGGVITFRGFLNTNGDNDQNQKNDGIWRGSVADGFTCILRRGDIGYAGMPGGSKVGNMWHSWLTNANHGAWISWLDVDGNGTSAAPTDVYSIFTDLSGAMAMIMKVGDVAIGTGGATFATIDLPVVGGQEQLAFIGKVIGGGVTAANNQGIWRSAPNGGPLTLAVRTGDVISTTQGPKTVQKLDFPGSNSKARQWEQPVMDSTGRMIVFVTFTDGSTSQVLVP